MAHKHTNQNHTLNQLKSSILQSIPQSTLVFYTLHKGILPSYSIIKYNLVIKYKDTDNLYHNNLKIE